MFGGRRIRHNFHRRQLFGNRGERGTTMVGITMQHSLSEMVDQNKSEKTAFQARETALTKAERKKSITW